MVLLGAGHSHVLALAKIAKAAKQFGVRVILISGDNQTPYSGYLPGVIAGLMPRQELMLDVVALASHHKVEYEAQNAVDIDLCLRQVVLESGAKISYDCLSINTGGNCQEVVAEGGGDVMPVKPVLPFLKWLERWNDTKRTTCAVVGAGVAGVEVALAVDARLRKRGRYGGVYLIGNNSQLIPKMPSLAASVQRLLEKRGISLILGARATAAIPGYIQLSDGTEHHADHVIVSTGVSPWQGLRKSGLEVDGNGNVLVNTRLQSVSHPDVLACGDCSSMAGVNIPKAGVYAVRQAPVLADNVIAKMSGKRLRSWQSTSEALAIISTGERSAIAHRAGKTMQGRLIWWWKCYLDRRFMQKFT